MLIMGILISITLISCEKDVVLNKDRIEPETNNLMQFADVESFKAHFEMMDKLYDTDAQEFDKFVKESPVRTPFQIILNDKFSDPNKRYQTFMDDPVMMAIVNEYYEFQIGEILLTVVDNQFILTSHINNSDARIQIRLLSKGENINLKKLPEDVFPVTDDSFEDVLGPWNESADYSIQKIFEKSNKSMSCKIDGSIGYSWHTTSYNQTAMHIQTSSYKSWGRTKEEANMFSYTYDIYTNEWEIGGSYVSVKIEADRRNSNCSSSNSESKTNSGYNAITRTRVSKWGKQYHSTGDVVGTFTQGGIVKTQTVPY